MFERLLVAIDESSAGEVGVSFAIAVARRHSAAVHVLYVNQYLLGGRGHTQLSHLQATELVRQAVEELEAAGIVTTGSVVRATCFDLAAAIIQTAEGWSADAIVLGSHRHRRLHRLLGRGTRERVIQLAALPVVTAPAPLKLMSAGDVMTNPGVASSRRRLLSR